MLIFMVTNGNMNVNRPQYMDPMGFKNPSKIPFIQRIGGLAKELRSNDQSLLTKDQN